MKRPSRRLTRDHGFTLVEIVIAIVLVGILSAVVVIGVGRLTSRGTDAACQTSLDAARAAATAHWATTGSQAITFTEMVNSGSLTLPSGATANGAALTGNGWTLTLSPASGAAPTFTCSTSGSLPVAGASLWLDASAGSSITTEAGGITRWADLTGNGNDARGDCSSQPTLTTIDGSNYVTFNGTNQQLAVDLTTPKTTIIAVVRSATTTWGSYGSILERRTSAGSRLGNIFEINNTAMHSNLYPAGVRRNGTPLTIPYNLAPVNQTMVLTITPTNPTGATALSIGGLETRWYSPIQLAELIVYPRTLTTQEALDTERALGAKWGVAVAGSGSGAIATGASMRLDASAASSITTDGGRITRWADLTGNGNDAREDCSIRPTLSTINGSNYVTFNGTNQQLAVDLTAPKTTIIAVVRSATTTWGSYGSILERRTTAGNRLGNIFEINSAAVHWNPSPAGVRRNGTTLTAPFNLAPVNQTMVLTITPSNPTGATALSIGGLETRWYSPIQLAELIVYPRTLTTQETQQVEQHLRAKWGIP